MGTVRDKVYGQAEQNVSAVHDKTTPSKSDAYKQVMSYSSKNPGKTILISFGIGAGLVFLLGAFYVHSHTGLFTRPMVKALSALLGSFSVKALWYLKKQYKKLGKGPRLKEMDDNSA